METFPDGSRKLSASERAVLKEERQLRRVYDVLDFLVANPTHNDYRIGAFAHAAQEMLLTDERLRAELRYMFDFRAERGRATRPAYGVNLFLRSAQDVLADRPEFAAASTTPEGWRRMLSSILDDPAAHEKFETNLVLREIQTNIPARYLGPKLILALYQHRFHGPLNLLDIGCSIGLGTKALVANRLDNPVRVLTPLPGDQPGSLDLRMGESEVSPYINQVRQRPLEFARSVGVDLILPRDIAQRNWVRHNLYPSELAERRPVVEEFDRLAELDVPQLSFEQVNFSSKTEIQEFISRSPVPQFDAITLVTVLYELKEKERAVVIRQAKNLLLPGGLLIIQDFARPNPNKRSGLEFFPLWRPYTYRTMVIDSLSPKARPEELLWWRDGRCEDLIVAPTANFFTAPWP